MTNLGVTKKVWEEWVGHPVSEADMRALTPEKVAPMYKRKYWDSVKGDELPKGVDYVVFDCAVNSGPGRAAKFLQAAVGAKVDGAIGPGTLKAVESMSPFEIIKKFNAARLEFLNELPTWDTFGKGWNRRVAEVTVTSNEMAA
jgi:lysozyme family protein